ncbi:MAG: serine hydrolase, partial [Verrucomicrobia bacterium]|nr:serine hydrolase [Cytophagales bacterium]
VGVEKDGSDKKINSSTIFEAASLSKPVFAYAVLRLYDRGLIDIDKPLLNYIGTYERFDAKNPNYGKITARMVLRHTTGLSNWGDEKSVGFLFPPDSCFSYSGEGYQFLQKVLEKKLNKSLNDIIQEEVFTPLKMESSSYVWNDKFAAVSSFGNSAEVINRHKNSNAAFSLLTNAQDFSIFLQALIKGVGLKPVTHKMMFEKQSRANRFKSKPRPADKYIDWGLGVGLQQNEHGKSVWHWGDNGSYKCFFMVYPKRNEFLVYFTHSLNGLNITDEIAKLFFGNQTCWVVKWLDYGYKSPVLIKELKAELAKKGYEYAREVVKEKKQKDSKYELSETDLNSLGYSLLQKEEIGKAVEIFKLNVSLFPESWNVYDSYGEALFKHGKKEEAVKMYQKSLELNPKNENAKKALEQILK